MIDSKIIRTRLYCIITMLRGVNKHLSGGRGLGDVSMVIQFVINDLLKMADEQGLKIDLYKTGKEAKNDTTD